MRAAIHAVIAALLAPGHVRVRDWLLWHATTRSRPLWRLRAWLADRRGRPGFRPSEFD